MGLDAVELCLELEDQLGIKILDEEGIVILGTTVGNAHSILMDKLNGVERKVPVLGPLYNEVYDVLKKYSPGWFRRNLQVLNKNFAPPTRVGIWQQLELDLKISLPKLECSQEETYPAIPRICESAFSLTYWIAEHDPSRVPWIKVNCERSGKMAGCKWSDDEVWDILRESIEEVFAVNPKDITPDARFVEDLGME